MWLRNLRRKAQEREAHRWDGYPGSERGGLDTLKVAPPVPVGHAVSVGHPPTDIADGPFFPMLRLGSAYPILHFGTSAGLGPTDLDVEVDQNGSIVAIWYRGKMLPFTVTEVAEPWAARMRRATEVQSELPGIYGMFLLEEQN